VGIHPTVAEDIIGLSMTKEDNGEDAKKGNCWGWETATVCDLKECFAHDFISPEEGKISAVAPQLRMSEFALAKLW